MYKVVRSKGRFLAVPQLLLGTLLILPLILAPQAQANTLVSSTPTSGAVLGEAPNALSITTAATLTDQGSSITVADPSGARVDDGSITISETTAVIGLKPLIAAGVYTVTYSLLSVGDVPLTGSYTFLFNAPASMTSATPTPAPSQSNSAATSVNHAADIVVILLILAALCVALFLLWYARLILRENSKARKSKKSVSTSKKRRAPGE